MYHIIMIVIGQGEVRNGRPHGQGRIDCANGDWQEGRFVDGGASGNMRVTKFYFQILVNRLALTA